MDDPRPFQGFHPQAIDFFRELAQDNSKAFWQAHRTAYQEHVRAPMEALQRSLEGLFGAGHLYRPNRDLRFAKDKRPYKEQAALSFGGRGPRALAARHVHLSANGLFVAVGGYRLEGPALAAFRKAVAAPRSGAKLVAIVSELAGKGYELPGEALKRAPQGFPADHPRLGLLRRKGMAAARRWTVEPWLFTPAAGDRILEVFADGEPLVAWLRRHLP